MLELYGHPFSSYTWKAEIALYANATPFDLRIVGEDPSASEFVSKAHPAGKFPLLVDKDAVIVETGAIIEYLAVAHPGKAPLIPTDAVEAARARMLERVFDNYVMANLQRVVAAHIKNPELPDPSEVEQGRAGLDRAYGWLEQWLSSNEIPADVSIVTCAAAPSLFYADWVQPIDERWSRVCALRRHLLSLPEVHRCVEEARPYRAYFPLGAPDRD